MRAAREMPGIDELALFDSCVTLGDGPAPGLETPLTAEGVLAVMDRHGIAEALVCSNEARLVHPRRRGNDRLLRDIAGSDRLRPAWVLTPPDRPDPARARSLVDEMVSAGVRAARLMMGHVPPLGWIWSDLCEALEQRRVVCLLDFAPPRAVSTQSLPDGLTLDKVFELARAFPHLPMILSHHCGGLGLSAATVPLLHRSANVLIDITSVVDYWRRIARELGPPRVVFATGMPFFDPATFVGNVQYDEHLDADAKKLICGGNLRRLLEAVR